MCFLVRLSRSVGLYDVGVLADMATVLHWAAHQFDSFDSTFIHPVLCVCAYGNRVDCRMGSLVLASVPRKKATGETRGKKYDKFSF